MTKDDTKKIIAAMVTAYPNYKPDNMSFTVDLWTEMLADYDYQAVQIGLKSYITTNTSGFAPSIGQLIDEINRFTHPPALNAMEAWSLVKRAMQNGCYHSVEEFARLPIEAQKAVGSPSQLQAWSMDEYFNENRARDNFINAYTTEVRRSEQMVRMPGQLRNLIEKMQNERQSKLDKPIEYRNLLFIDNQEKYVPMPSYIEDKLR